MTGKLWARIGFTLGIGVSVSGNIAHQYTLGTPPPGAVIAAAFWPVSLFISLEVISRVDWPHGNRWLWIRYGGVSAVALIAAVLSYAHMSQLLHSYGESWFTAGIGPLAVDGMMCVCSAALMVGDRRIDRPQIGTLR